jgi:methyltransferase-like protein/trans-aconitate methyltransferase
MTESTQTSYDDLPYGSQAFPQTHPDRMAVVAKLFGMVPVPLETCRVLELGCASGGNLLPMASQLPRASFVGFDLSARQIADGNQDIAKLGLRNVKLNQMDIMKVDASIGKFDYIIAHGVYSWVPPAVQAKILSICRDNLSPNGVSYISYNTYPGWRMRGMLRDMMLYHSKQFADPKQKVQQARAMLDFMTQNVPVENNPYGLMLKQEVESLRGQADWYLFHEHLEDVNEPIYFHDFADRAAKQGLQYLGESEFHTMLASNFPTAVQETLRKIAPDIIRTEQLMDFLRNRPFRQTLLVHQKVLLNRNVDWRSLEGCELASPAKPAIPGLDPRVAGTAQFKAPSGATLNTSNPIVKSAMTIMSERWPQSISFADLDVAARARLDTVSAPMPDAPVVPQDAKVMGAELLQCVAAGMVEVRMLPANFINAAGEYPTAPALVRHQASKGLRVTNSRHESVNLDEFNRQLVMRLDGQHNRAALLDVLEQLVKAGVLSIRQEGRAIVDSVDVRLIMSNAMDANLVSLAKAGLIEA